MRAIRALLNDRWVMGLLLAGLAVLLCLAVARLRHARVELPEISESGPGEFDLVPIKRIHETVVASDEPVVPVFPGAGANPFYTAYFQPPVPAPVQPPTTRQVEMTYSGLIETADGHKRAFLQVGEQLIVAPLGGKVVADLAVARIQLRSVVLTNSAGASNVLAFNVKQTLEVPVQ